MTEENSDFLKQFLIPCVPVCYVIEHLINLQRILTVKESLLKAQSLLSHVWLFVTPWTIARPAPLSMEILQVR